MTTAPLVQTDLRLRDAVMHQLEWDPDVVATCRAVGVAVAHRIEVMPMASLPDARADHGGAVTPGDL